MCKNEFLDQKCCRIKTALVTHLGDPWFLAADLSVAVARRSPGTVTRFRRKALLVLRASVKRKLLMSTPTAANASSQSREWRRNHTTHCLGLVALFCARIRFRGFWPCAPILDLNGCGAITFRGGPAGLAAPPLAAVAFSSEPLLLWKCYSLQGVRCSL